MQLNLNFINLNYTHRLKENGGEEREGEHQLYKDSGQTSKREGNCLKVTYIQPMSKVCDS